MKSLKNSTEKSFTKILFFDNKIKLHICMHNIYYNRYDKACNNLNAKTKQLGNKLQ